VTIAIGVRGNRASPDVPARVRYVRLEGATRAEKLAAVASVADLAELSWREVSTGWGDPFLPLGQGPYFDWPELRDILPWQHSGVQFKRSWPIAEAPSLLEGRLAEIEAAAPSIRPALFKGAATRVARSFNGEFRSASSSIGRYAFRAFDVQWALLDPRFADRPRPALHLTNSESQVFFTTLFSEPLAEGPGLIANAFIPDLHNFRGSYGGKDVIPLYRDSAATEPNITPGILEYLSEEFGEAVSAEELVAYIYGVMGGLSYTRRFWVELESPGPRVPISRNIDVFRRASELGRHLINLHTYGERFGSERRITQVPQGSARCTVGISGEMENYPQEWSYDLTSRLVVGDGVFEPVSPEIMAFEVSGLQVVKSWLDYRMKDRAGKKSSPLDSWRPVRWTASMTDDLLELVWVLERSIAMEPELSATLDQIVAGPTFAASELAHPSEEGRQAPRASSDLLDDLQLFPGLEKPSSDAGELE
ncbi:MAG: hypothetical protein IT546_07150, partial [Caulobacteraceae bacterium]|nr:hypothetical protein [Caulobacteraceae bacterium]